MSLNKFLPSDVDVGVVAGKVVNEMVSGDIVGLKAGEAIKHKTNKFYYYWFFLKLLLFNFSFLLHIYEISRILNCKIYLLTET